MGVRWPWARDWELIDKEIIPSPLKTLVDQGSSVGEMQGLGWCNTVVVLTFKCKLTGRVKIERIDSHE